MNNYSWSTFLHQFFTEHSRYLLWTAPRLRSSVTVETFSWFMDGSILGHTNGPFITTDCVTWIVFMALLRLLSTTSTKWTNMVVKVGLYSWPWTVHSINDAWLLYDLFTMNGIYVLMKNIWARFMCSWFHVEGGDLASISYLFIFWIRGSQSFVCLYFSGNAKYSRILTHSIFNNDYLSDYTHFERPILHEKPFLINLCLT